jgi:hypothetical protein
MDSNEYFGDTCKTPIDQLRQALKRQYLMTFIINGFASHKVKGIRAKTAL